MNMIKKQLYIPTTQKKRTIRVLVPDDYTEGDKSYPVIYMHDGQNLFEDRTAYNQSSWRIYETLSKLKKEGKINKDVIVVGIDNSDLRFFEYSPWVGKDYVKKMLKVQVGGLGDVYADFVVKKVKPYIDKNFRTLPDYENTSIAGSSMGAYISTYIAAKHPDIFKNVGVFSLASWFNEEDFLNYIDVADIKMDQRFFISIGKNESSDPSNKNFNKIYLNNSRHLKKHLEQKNVEDIFYIETDDIHNELAWRKMFETFALWLLKK
ncbi:hypothetical protein BK010_07175 [Tenericutes bacterium MO-XQ]|nr:hypothetical protein BK010_07175 [Tenericutes bacterium MO-XQ]